MKLNAIIISTFFASIFLTSTDSFAEDSKFSPNLKGKSLTNINLTPPKRPLILNVPLPSTQPSVFDIPNPPPISPSISFPKLEIPIGDNVVIKPIRTPGSKIPGAAIRWTW